MEIEKKIKTITKEVEVYTVNGEEFESYKNAQEYLVTDFYDNQLEKYRDELFGWELFKCNTRDEFEMVEYWYDRINFYVFDVKFDYNKENYPIRCIYTQSGEVYSIGEKLYEGLIEFNKEK